MRDQDEIILPDGRRVPMARAGFESTVTERRWTDALPVFVRGCNGAHDRRQQPRYDVRARLFDIVA